MTEKIRESDHLISFNELLPGLFVIQIFCAQCYQCRKKLLFIVFFLILGKRVIYTYPMVKQTDMADDMKAEVMEMCVNACEKHTTNNENAAKMIKELLDKKFGTSWHVVRLFEK